MRLVWALALGLVTSTHASGDEPLKPVDPSEDPPPPVPPPPVEAPAVEPPPPVEAAAEPAPAAVEPVSTPEPARDDDMIDPSTLPGAGTPSYPRPFVERPLLLPSRLREINFGSSLSRESVGEVRLRYLGLDVSGRRAFDWFELAVGGNIIALHDNNIPDGYVEPEVPLFQRVYLTARWRLPAQIAIGVQAVIGNVLTDYQRYSPSLFVQAKIRTSARGAIYVTGGGDYNYGNEDDGNGSYVSQRVGAYATGTALLQATDEIAVQASATGAYYNVFEPFKSTYRVLAGAVSLLVSSSDRVDVAPYVSISRVGEIEIVGGGVSFSMR